MLWRFVACLSILTLLHHSRALSAGFDAREATIESVQHSLFTGLSTCREVVSAFITRIEAGNSNINAIVSLNPNALSTADTLDGYLAAGNATGPLFCVPVLLKDNYDTVEMNTTGGCLGLRNSRPTADAPTVTALKRAGAVILGKVNLHELALEGLSVSSYGGQTLNPYDFSRTPGGSSGGSGAAVAASFSVFATGTDTVNSLRSPASANSLFSIRPTRGLISRAGVIPISYTQDALGVIARTVKDVAAALTVMASVGYSAADNTTALVPAASQGLDYAASLASSSHSLKGARLGLLETFFNRTASDETTPVNVIMDNFVKKLEAAGAVVVPVNESIYDAPAIASALDVQRFEYRQQMDRYLGSSNLSGTFPGSLAELYATNKTTGAGPGNGSFLVIPSEREYVATALASSTSNASYAATQAGIRDLALALQATFSRHALDALVYPEQRNLVVKLGAASQAGRNGILAALTGSPVVTVPAGFSNASADAPLGVPVGMEMLGRPWSEPRLLGLGWAVEKLGRVRRAPGWAKAFLEPRSYESVPVLGPDSGSVPAAYPVGVL